MSTFEHPIQNQIPKKQTFSQKMKHFWLKYGEKIILAIGIVLIALVSFEAGFLKGQKNQKDTVEVNQAICPPNLKNEEKNANNQGSSAISLNKQSVTASQTESEMQNCALVASKNSDKYHLSSCQWATKIKPENRICFSSVEEAQKRGYQTAKCCQK